ncbi:conserved hypothetical protein [Paenibacillus curdlanolyticus YK9]|uniref:Carrier domain-containing protein n=1 Tax=Paenibacillus curdlanolyticus YK9 TaxID=717606 RepID=E0I7E9_9BACL|nr:phosphopantetheine-binding protein [Paenibacillus curdlanolyticus]EFM11965.1 conserved hypothetical protein [Paenibacillus curdlanolyticus YK9]
MLELDVKGKAKPFLLKALRRKDIADDEDVFAVGALNSLFAMQLILFLEKEFQIRVENKDLNLDYFRTLNAIDAFVSGKLDRVARA